MSENNIAYLLGKRLDKKKYQPSNDLIDSTIGIGVEVEIENVNYFHHQSNYPDIFSLWKAVEDGSLREGTEFIFDGPLKGINITDALAMMQDFLNVYIRKGNPPKVSDRCSIHIHLDVSDLNKNELNNLILVYYLIERVLFAYINPLRIKNNYCRPLTDSSFKYTLKRLLNNNYDGDMIQIIKSECDKYSALNVLPITNFGSIEFRHHHGTTNMSEVLNWINIIMRLKVCSLKWNITSLLDYYNMHGTIPLMQLIFDGTLLSDEVVLKLIPNLDLYVSNGALDLIEILNFDDLTKSINKRRSSNKSLLEQYNKMQTIGDAI